MDNDLSQPAEQGQGKTDPVLELNFVPTWARQPPARNPYAHFEGKGREDEGRRGGWGGGRRDDRRGPRRDKPGRAGPGPGPGGAGRGGPPRGGPARDPRHFPPRARGGPPRERSEPWREPEALNVNIAFIPDRDRLGVVVKDLHASGRAYPLFDLALKFLSHPQFYRVKVECRKGAPGGPPCRLFQCKECGALYTERAAAVAHIVRAHRDLFLETEEIQGEPPSGNFVCIARCRLSGELLGPPNYHGYNERLMDLYRSRYSGMPLDAYRNQIEMIRDPELIEQWKQSCSRRTVCRVKGQENAPELKPAEADRYIAETCAPPRIAETARAIVPAQVAERMDDPRLKAALRDAWVRETRRPFSLMLALRPAFHHMRLFLFNTPRGGAFVTRVQPYPIEPGKAVSPIAEVLQFLREKPGCTRQELVEQLRPGAAADSPQVAEVISPLRWLVEKGHVVEFFDGTLAVMGKPPSAEHRPPH